MCKCKFDAKRLFNDFAIRKTGDVGERFPFSCRQKDREILSRFSSHRTVLMYV